MAETDLTSSPGKKSSQVEPEKTIPVKALGVEFGADQNLPFSTPFYMADILGKSAKERLSEVMNPDSEYNGPTLLQLKAMRRLDGQARALYRLLTLPIRSALKSATFVPAEEGGEAEAEFITQVFRTPPASGGMSVPFPRFIAQLLTALFDGFAAFEKVYEKPTFGPLQGKYTLKKLAHRPAETITFITDDTGGFEGIRQRTYVNGKMIDIFIPTPYAFYYAAQEEERKFYGVSFFESAFYHYDKKAKMYFIAHLAAQRTAVGTRVGSVPPGATRKAKADFARDLSNLATAQWMLIPDTFKVEMLKDSGTFDFLNWVNHHNSQMSKSILANFFDKDQGAGGGDGAVVDFGQPSDATFVLMLRSIMDDVAESINNYIIPQLVDLNFNTAKYPKFTWGKLTDEQKAAISKTFEKLATAGQSSLVTPEFMRELEKSMADEFGFSDIDYDEIEKREEAEAAELKAQQKKILDAKMNPAIPGAGNANLPDGSAPAQQAVEQFTAKLTDQQIEDELVSLSGELLAKTARLYNCVG